MSNNMISFTCNICGAENQVVDFATERATCACGSNVRLRALIHLLSMELFGHDLLLRDFPKLKAIRGIGMTDNKCYAEILADKFDYSNTFYDRKYLGIAFVIRHTYAANRFQFRKIPQ